MFKGMKFFSAFCILFFLMISISNAAPKDKITPSISTLINLDLYASTYTNKFFSVKGTGGDQSLNVTRTNIDATNRTTTWHYIRADGTESKEVYSYIQNEIGQLYTNQAYYQYDYFSKQFFLASTADVTPPVNIWPKGQIDYYQTWGGIFSYVRKDADGNIMSSENQWREYRFCGYEDVTVPYGTFEDALKIRRLRANGGFSNYWYVPELGMIKSENIWRDTGYMEIQELVSASY